MPPRHRAGTGQGCVISSWQCGELGAGNARVLARILVEIPPPHDRRRRSRAEAPGGVGGPYRGAALLVALLITWFSWRFSFVAVGILSTLWAVACCPLLPNTAPRGAAKTAPRNCLFSGTLRDVALSLKRIAPALNGAHPGAECHQSTILFNSRPGNRRALRNASNGGSGVDAVLVIVAEPSPTATDATRLKEELTGLPRAG